MTQHHTLRSAGGYAIFLALAACSVAARADDASCAQQEQAGLQSLSAANVYGQIGIDCYGVDGENNPTTTEVRAVLHKKNLAAADIAAALRLISQRVSEHPEVYQPDAARTQFVAAVSAAAARVDAVDSPGTTAVAPVRWQFASALRPPAAVSALDVGTSLDASCTDKSSAGCKDAMTKAKAWIRVTVLTESALQAYSASYVASLAAESALRLSRWHAYRDDGLPQFQWEWLLNSWRLTHKETRPLDQNGQPEGPRAVPTDQIILLHPGIGVEWRDAVASGSKTQAAVYLELLGINRWSWKDDTADMGNAVGISAVATYAKRDQATSVGYGLMFHFRSVKPLALAITKSGGDTSIVLNIDLAEYVKDKMDYWSGVGKEAAAGTSP